MKCYGIGFIQTYIDGELSYDTRKEFTKHLDTCEACRDLLVEISRLNQWENVMLDEESAHSPQEIKIDVEQAWKTFESRSKLDNVSNINHKKQQKKGLFTNMNKKSKRFIYTAVAAALFTTAMIPQVQVAATNVASYFSDAITNDKVVNEGIQDKNGVTQDMMKNGQYIPIDEKITDQGITVHFKELYIADSRISVHYRMEKADGSLVPFEFDTSGLELRSDGKINGQQEENPELENGGGIISFIQDSDDHLPFELMAAGKKLEHVGIRDKDKPEGVVTFVEGPEGKEAFKQPLTLDVNINKIGKVAGSWKGEIQIDTSHLKNKTN
ncbi:DUF4179 domain-containing protein [Bacillus paramycoides]|uniref:DUF4179 domain-containing protein n=1 Tax=Bacillus paramycoides TaxID=2026194 RepID=UPI002E1BBEE0|nr:DUF4179 domain-containing protein [Bacillus paramycoides]